MLKISRKVSVTGNMHVTFYYNGRYKKDNKMFGFWLHTSFMDQVPDSVDKDALGRSQKEIKLFKVWARKYYSDGKGNI